MDWLVWQMRARIRSGATAEPWFAGMRLWAKRGETGITGNLYTGLHEFEDMAYALHVLRPQSLFVDIGANSGSYTVLAAGAVGCQVVALEPVPTTFARLRANVELNRLECRVRAVNAAAGAAESRIRFTSLDDSMNHALAEHEHAAGVIEVDVLRLDGLLNDEVPELVKIDVEGYELPVLQGASRCFSASGANSVLIELNGSGSRYGWTDHQVANALFAAGYETYRYEPFSRRLIPKGHEMNETGNTLFIRDATRASRLVAQAPSFDVKGVKL